MISKKDLKTHGFTVIDDYFQLIVDSGGDLLLIKKLSIPQKVDFSNWLSHRADSKSMDEKVNLVLKHKI